MAHPNIGRYSLVRTGWRCNLCGNMTYTKKIKHKCGNAPHFMSEKVITTIPKNKVKDVLGRIGK